MQTENYFKIPIKCVSSNVMFGTILISIITVFHVYVFLRLASVPVVKRHIPKKILFGVCILLWAVFYLGRVYGHNGNGALAAGIEFAGMTWMGTVMLVFICVLAVDIVTLFGLLFRQKAPAIRGWAFVAGIGLAAFALFQGMRAPVITDYEIEMNGLPKIYDGLIVVALADTHLGPQIGEEWLSARVEQVQAERPDMILLLGDIFEGHVPRPEKLISIMRRFSAPLGVWGVTGNHEYHGGGSVHLMEKARIRLLRDKWVQVLPGLILAGVDDISVRRRIGMTGAPVKTALKNRPPGATIYLSHSPLYPERASHAGADLMLSGHTHGGQIWPFNYLVQKRYQYVAGKYDVLGMPLIVCRGTGTWGPRMRLWYPGEILKIKLRVK